MEDSRQTDIDTPSMIIGIMMGGMAAVLYALIFGLPWEEHVPPKMSSSKDIISADENSPRQISREPPKRFWGE